MAKSRLSGAHKAVAQRGGLATMVPALRPDPGLFDRIGGRATVARIVDVLYAGIEADTELRPMFRNNLAPGIADQMRFLEEWLGGRAGMVADPARLQPSPTHAGLSGADADTAQGPALAVEDTSRDRTTRPQDDRAWAVTGATASMSLTSYCFSNASSASEPFGVRV